MSKKKEIEHVIVWLGLIALCIAFWILVVWGLCGCGADACNPAHEGNTKQDNALLHDLARIFAEAGYGEPCCPTKILHEGDPRVGELKQKDFCGVMFGPELGDCSEILIDDSLRRHERCPDIEATIFHEWLHSIGYDHGPGMEQAVAKLMLVYWETWLEVNG